MKKLLLIGGLLMAFSCHKEQFLPNTCQVSDPLNQLGWLKDSIAHSTIGDITVAQGLYQGQTVFSISSVLGIDAASDTFYRCDGSIICRSNITIAGQSGNCETVVKELTNRVVIYQKSR